MSAIDKAEEDVLIAEIESREAFEPKDRLTPRMHARRLIDLLDDERERQRRASCDRIVAARPS